MSEGIVVTAQDPVTGHQAWQLRQEGVGGEALAGSRVAVTDSRAFVAGQRRGSNDLVVLAVDAGTGRTSWLAEDAGAAAVYVAGYAAGGPGAAGRFPLAPS